MSETPRKTESWRGVRGATLFQATDEQGQPIDGPQVFVLGWVHGNEPVGGQTLDHLEGLVGHLTRGSLVLVRANLEANALDLRHTPGGRDLNRLFDRRTLQRLGRADPETLCYEERRALELAPLLMDADVVLDLHSTSRPAAPFLLFRDDQAHSALALELGVGHLITGVYEGGILDGGMASTAGLAPGERSERMGFVFEAGQHSEPANVERAWMVTWRLLWHTGVWREQPPAADVEVEVYEVMDRFRQAPEGQPQWQFVGYGDTPGDPSRRATPRSIVSFETVEPDELILRRPGEVVRAQGPFTMLMPAPASEPGADLYYVAQPRHGGLGVRPRTDDEARLEAQAIERMLDLLEDDDFATGTTWASFDDRIALDLAADLVGRTLRLPEGHAHRRLTVIGRGDWDGSEAERRAGQRYRRAMRHALVGGVPIERIQLLRGATLTWIDSLTSDSTAAMLRRRGDAPVELYLSARQPHTLSVLISGDLDLALREADFRYVRIALVLEVSSVRASGDQVTESVLRAGLVSGRPEVVKAAWRMREALIEEHQSLMQRPLLAEDVLLQQSLGPRGSLRPSADPERMAFLGQVLRQLQVRLWRDALSPAALAAKGPDDASIARWLVQTMSETGIRDVNALRSLLVQEGESWRVEPALLDLACEYPEDFAIDPPTRQPAPPAPIAASEVHRDSLERWVGWKRFIRRAQVVPDTRGKDIDLAFTAVDMHLRVAEIYQRARALGEAMPGRVMVVVAGDGQAPVRVGPGPAQASREAHRALLHDAQVRYLRIQHLQGTHLAWMKDTLEQLDLRSDGATVGLALESEHGALVSVVLLLVQDAEVAPSEPWSLEGWRPEACAVVITEFDVRAQDYAVGLFAGPLHNAPDRINLDLLHFGRAYCEGLLRQIGPRARFMGQRGVRRPFEKLLRESLAAWVLQVRAGRDRQVHPAPPDPVGREKWVMRELGIADPNLAQALARQIDGRDPAEEVASRLWAAVGAWQGGQA